MAEAGVAVAGPTETVAIEAVLELPVAAVVVVEGRRKTARSQREST